MNNSNTILSLEHVSKEFTVESKELFQKRKTLKAVTDVTLNVKYGESLALVGESGCGKSTIGRLMIKLLNPTHGRILFKGNDVSKFKKQEMRMFRKEVQMVFQDPFASLNPRMTVEEIILDPMEVQNIANNDEKRRELAYHIMNECGLDINYAKRYPHQFSGGQRQRIGIARTLSVEPKLLVCDEPVSALDVSIQAQIINLLENIKAERGLTLVFISHDLRVVNYIADRVAVMYLGRIVEIADTNELYSNPLHPYTKALLASIPKIGEGKFDMNKTILEGNVPSPMNLPTGCSFQHRCIESCSSCGVDGDFELKEIKDGHWCSCKKVKENSYENIY